MSEKYVSQENYQTGHEGQGQGALRVAVFTGRQTAATGASARGGPVTLTTMELPSLVLSYDP